MSKAKLITALLMNIFVMPGGGHFFIKRKLRGIMYLLVVLVILFIFAMHVGYILMHSLPVINPGQVDALQMMEFSTALTQNILSEYSFIIKIYGYLLGLCYIVSTADLILIYLDTKE